MNDESGDGHKNVRSGGLNRRDFLKAGALGLAAGATPGCAGPGTGSFGGDPSPRGNHRGYPAGTGSSTRSAPRRPAPRPGAHRFRRRGRNGDRARAQPRAHRRVRHHRRLRRRGGPRRAGRRHRRGCGAPPPGPLHPRGARLRAPVRRGGPRPGLHRHPLALARTGVRRCHGEREARGHRGARRLQAGGLLAARGDGRAHPPPLRHDGERELRPAGTPLPQPGAPRAARRDPARRVRLPARPARDQVRRRGRGTVAGAPTPGRAMATSTPPMAWARSPTAWTSTGATASTIWCR